MANRIYDVDGQTAILLANLASLAYETSTPPVPPLGYNFVQYWWGNDANFWGGNGDERYGIIFQSASDPGSYVFSFRGTATFLDALEDLASLAKTEFKYYTNQSAIPNSKPWVGDGFDAVYSTPTQNGSGSMQDQLFNFIKANKVTKLQITGHSLGSALAQLFSIDLYNYFALNRNIQFPVLHYNFASPRVGDSTFVHDYNALEQFCHAKTVRFLNFEDDIPCLPPALLGFHHAPDYFMFTFYPTGAWNPITNRELKHSIVNDCLVLEKAIFADGVKLPIRFKGYNDYEIECDNTAPNTTECQLWADQNQADAPKA